MKGIKTKLQSNLSSNSVDKMLRDDEPASRVASCVQWDCVIMYCSF